MDQTQETYLQMNKVIAALNNEYAAIWSSLPAFVRANGTVNTSIMKREQILQLHPQTISELGWNRNYQYAKATDIVLDIVRKAFAYAVDINDYDLLAQLSFDRKSLAHLPAYQQLSLLTSMMRRAALHLDVLQDYGVTSDGIALAATRLLRLHEQLVTADERAHQHSPAVQSFLHEEASCRRALHVMDLLIGNFEEAHLTYVRRFKAARAGRMTPVFGRTP